MADTTEPTTKKPRAAGTEHLRFDLGERVACNTGEWTPGVVVKHNYRESSWPAEKIAPYQIKLDDGRLIFAPIDDDRVIRLYDGEAAPQEGDVPDSEKIPVTIITGFLGSGKTTLVNYILTSKEHGMRICVIENEFGAVNIDENLVQENLRTNEDIISMDNGCVCCTVRGDLVRALKTLAKRKDTFDCVIIETTGLADPAPVCFTFNTEPTIERIFRVDGILTLVDAKHIEEHLDEVKAEDAVNEAVQQVAFADRILLNKIDLVTKEDIKRIKGTIHSINSYAEVMETQQSKIDLKKILGLEAFSLERVQEIDPDWEPEEEEEECTEDGCTQDHDHGHAHGHEHGDACKDSSCTQAHDHDHGHAHGHEHDAKMEEAVTCKESNCTDTGHDHSHDHGHAHKSEKKPRKKHDLSGVGSVGFTLEGNLDSAEFNKFMGELLQKSARDLYRSKGVLSFAGEGDTKFVFQGVHEQIVCQPALKTWEEGEKRINKMVFIGRNLDKAALETSFKACLAK
jgi:G3E family GTPase